MSDRDHAMRLLAVAERDMRALKGMLDVHAFSDEWFGFAAQQVIEKCLKAWIAASGEEYPFTHDLSRLLQRLERSGQDVDDLWDLVEFSPFGVLLRYTDLPEDYEPLDRATTLAATGNLLSHVRALVDRMS